MKKLQHLFNNNVAWANEIKKDDPHFFSRLSKQQAPEYLWIGCSDSRVPANEIMNLPPGQMFVHRNIANVVVHNDINCLSVIQYAVEYLKVKHIIICGHYGCGGVQAAIDDQDYGLINDWLQNIRNVSSKYSQELSSLDEQQKKDRLCELNIIEQVKNVCDTDAVKTAWKNGAELSVHGWIYNLSNGILQDLETSISPN